MKPRIFFYLIFVSLSLFAWIMMYIVRVTSLELLSIKLFENIFFGLILCFQIIYILYVLPQRPLKQRFLYFLIIVLLSFVLFSAIGVLAYKIFDLIIDLSEYNLFSNKTDGLFWLLVFLITVFLLTTIVVWEIFARIESRINKCLKNKRN